MTLIVALVTARYALLASDRRITSYRRVRDPETGAVREVEITASADKDTKAAMLDGRYAMGFAGLGRIQHKNLFDRDGEPLNERMESWLAATLGGLSPSEYFDEISCCFGEAAEAQGYFGDHAFLAAGFDPDGNAQLVRIDNRTAQKHSFHPYITDLGTDSFILDFAGVVPSKESAACLREFIYSAVSKYPERPDAVLGRIRALYRAVAATSSGTVGVACSVTTFPQSAVPILTPVIVDMSTPPPETYASSIVSLHYPAAGDGRPATYFSPAYISKWVVAMGACAEFGRTEFLDDPPSGYRL